MEKQIIEMSEEILQEYTNCYSDADQERLEKMLRKLASDVAEEIFAEIEKLRPITKLVIKDLGEWDFDKNGEKFYWLSETEIAELKKKYSKN
jgi:regulator of sirC expression with transglutaminase-like and TPR domain